VRPITWWNNTMSAIFSPHFVIDPEYWNNRER
jgi:hypothetical protein